MPQADRSSFAGAARSTVVASLALVRKRRTVACGLLIGGVFAGALPGAGAQNIPDAGDWREQVAPSAPAFDVARLLALPKPPGAALTVGIDPTTLSIGRDGVVRYVFLATSDSGAVNASYEGIRCDGAEFRRYARWQPESSRWQPLEGTAGAGASSAGGSAPGDWQSLRAPAGRYALQLARSGLCQDAAPNRSVRQIVQDLRTPALTASP